MDNVVLIAAVEADHAAETAGPTVEEKVKAAMKATRGHWMATREEDQFLAACEGAARHLGEDERARMVETIRIMNALGSAVSGVPVDFGALIPENEEDRIEPYPLRKWWEETA